MELFSLLFAGALVCSASAISWEELGVCPSDCSHVAICLGVDQCRNGYKYIEEAGLCGCCGRCVKFITQNFNQPCIGNFSDVVNYLRNTGLGTHTPTEDYSAGLELPFCDEGKECVQQSNNQMACSDAPNEVASDCQEKRAAAEEIIAQDPDASDWIYKPECDPDGTYHEIQCEGRYGSNGRCFCTDDLGVRIFGERYLTDEDAIQTCKCALDRYERDQETNGLTLETLKCDKYGNYDILQCDSNEQLCYCMDPETSEITSTAVPLTLWQKLPCYNSTTMGSRYFEYNSCLFVHNQFHTVIDYFEKHGVELLLYRPNCDADGTYKPVQDEPSARRCYQKDGTPTNYQQQYGGKETMTCFCSRDEAAGINIAACDQEGSYKNLYLYSPWSFCVNDNGYQSTRRIPIDVYCCLRFAVPRQSGCCEDCTCDPDVNCDEVLAGLGDSYKELLASVQEEKTSGMVFSKSS